MQPKSDKPSEPVVETHAWIFNSHPRVYHMHGRTRRDVKELDGSTTVSIEPIVVSFRPGLNRVEIAKLTLVGFGMRAGDVAGLRPDASEWAGALARCEPSVTPAHLLASMIADTPDGSVIRALKAIEKRPDVKAALDSWAPPKRRAAENANDE